MNLSTLIQIYPKSTKHFPLGFLEFEFWKLLKQVCKFSGSRNICLDRFPQFRVQIGSDNFGQLWIDSDKLGQVWICSDKLRKFKIKLTLCMVFNVAERRYFSHTLEGTSSQCLFQFHLTEQQRSLQNQTPEIKVAVTKMKPNRIVSSRSTSHLVTCLVL